MHKCPNCKKNIDQELEKQIRQAKFFPFCSKQCKLIDLGAWFDAEYTIPCKPEDHEIQGQ